MSEAIDTTLVRSGTWGSLWIDGEQVAECYGCQAKISKTKESVPRCRAMMEDSKLVSTKGTGSIRIYNATSRLIELEGEALKTGKDLRHTIISNLDDPDNPNNQRIALMGVSFDDLNIAQHRRETGGAAHSQIWRELWKIPSSIRTPPQSSRLCWICCWAKRSSMWRRTCRRPSLRSRA